MADKVWIGGIYIKNVGYKIILKSLGHYKKRLKTISNSPEVQGAAGMFGSILQSEAMKTYPAVQQTFDRVRDCLSEKIPLASLQDDLDVIKKALACYESDIIKADDTGHEYFLSLIGDVNEAENNISSIRTAISKIYEFE